MTAPSPKIPVNTPMKHVRSLNNLGVTFLAILSPSRLAHIRKMVAKLTEQRVTTYGHHHDLEKESTPKNAIGTAIASPTIRSKLGFVIDIDT